MSGGGITTNSSRLDEDRRTFLGSFDSGDWSGNVTAYVTAGTSATPVAWSYASANNAGAVDFKDGTVLTSVGASNVGKYFSTTAPSNGLTAAEITGLARATGDAQVTALQNLAYLRGDSQLERRKGGQLRNRTSPVGDIVNSSPFFERETNTLYVGSNDGFLHAMSGQDGTPRFRYMPRGINLEQLGRLSDPAYGSDDQTHPHRYFVDGNIHVSPKLVSRALDKNFLLGAMGRGGKGVFLLDVTNPTAMGPSQVLWDRTFQGTTGPSTDESTHMGMVLGESVILKDDYDLTSGNQDNRFSGHTIAIVPNGINSQSGSAVLFIYRLGANGAIIGSPVVLDTQTTNNGMTSIGAVDTNGNGRVDTIYGGDLRGNIWKFVMEGEAWKFAHRPNNGAAQPMFTAVGPTGAAQAITSGIAAKREPASGKMMLTFGTGRYISADDVTSTAVQTVYAVVDHANARITGGRSALQQRTFPMHGTIDGRAVRSLEGWPLNGLRYLETKSGWFLDLGVPMAGERVIARPQIYGDMLAIGTLIPRPSNDPCDQGRTTGFTILANVFTGTNPKATGGGTGSYYGDGTVTVPGAGGGENAFVGSQQSDVGGIGGIRITSTQVIAGGMDAQIEPTNWNNPSSSTPKRISWREIVGNN